MLYVQLDANWPDNPKVIDAGLAGAGLHAVTLCIAKRLATDGWVARPVLHRQGADDELIDRLVELGLFEAGQRGVRPHDWHDRNPSQAALDAKRRAKQRSAQEGNHKRWKHDGDLDDCVICCPEPQVVAGSDPTRSHTDRKASPYTETAASDATSDAPRPSAKDQQQLIWKACRLLAEERAVGRDVGEGWIVNATKGIYDDNHQRLEEHLATTTQATPVELMELMEPTKRTPQKTGGVIVDEELGIFLPGTGWCSRTRAS